MAARGRCGLCSRWRVPPVDGPEWGVCGQDLDEAGEVVWTSCGHQCCEEDGYAPLPSALEEAEADYLAYCDSLRDQLSEMEWGD